MPSCLIKQCLEINNVVSEYSDCRVNSCQDVAVNTRLKHAGLSRDVSFKQILVGSETSSKYSFGISSLSFSIQMKNGSNKLT